MILTFMRNYKKVIMTIIIWCSEIKEHDILQTKQNCKTAIIKVIERTKLR